MLAIRVEEVFCDSGIYVNILCATIRGITHKRCFCHSLELLT